MLFLLLGCTAGEGGPADTSLDGGAAAAVGCPAGVKGEAVGTLDEPDLDEASGLVVSPGRPGLLWSHNDSGGSAELFGLDLQGQLVQRVTVSGATGTDWEDLAGGVVDGQPVLFVGDIGDNPRARVYLEVWQVPEPAEGETTVVATRHELQLPDGARDVEAMMVDPVSGDLLLVTKEYSGPAEILRGAAPLGAEVPMELEATLDLSLFPGVLPGAVTGGDVSPDGGCIYLRTYAQVLAWSRVTGSTVAATLTLEPTVMPSLEEAQGETVAADVDGYWTLSEGEGVPLHRFRGAVP